MKSVCAWNLGIGAIGMALTFSWSSPAAETSRSRLNATQTKAATVKLLQFGYREVTLEGGPLDAQAKGARSFYLALSEDSLLQGFRLRAGLPAPGKPMGGWYDPDGFAGGHPFGQYVSALARMYASTGDTRFKQKVARLVHGFKETLGQDGFFYSSQKVFKEWPCYLYDKNCIGMRDAFTLTGNKEALTVLSRMTDWAVKNLPRRSDEWYTLPENLYSCFALTGERRYLDLAKEYDYSEGFYDSFAQGKNAFSPKLHAYSHVNTLCSAARIYEATGDVKYLHALENAWRFLTTTQMYASGGWGPDERFVEEGKGKLAASLASTGQGFETPCGSYANINLDRYMLRFTADSKFGDNLERVLYNGILAALPPNPDGHSFYYSDYRPGAIKLRRPDLWTCCSGTYAQATADYPLDIYFHGSNDLYVNLFVPSEVKWKRGQIAVVVKQSTDYPKNLSTRFVVETAKPTKFGLNVRVPAWTNGA
ncbi:MAG: beta-L-arabinofuranosidase domain-containing protein, partial [Bryobacteraceae bacterium]